MVLPWGLLLDASHTWPIQASHHVCSRSSTLQADPILFISVENTHHCILTPTGYDPFCSPTEQDDFTFYQVHYFE